MTGVEYAIYAVFMMVTYIGVIRLAKELPEVATVIYVLGAALWAALITWVVMDRKVKALERELDEFDDELEDIAGDLIQVRCELDAVTPREEPYQVFQRVRADLFAAQSNVTSNL